MKNFVGTKNIVYLCRHNTIFERNVTRMKSFLWAIPIAALLMAGCGGNRSDLASELADSLMADTLTADSADMSDALLPTAADELFDDFIFNFAANRKLQLARIQFPLRMTEAGKVRKIDKAQWKMEYFFMRQGYYTLLFDSERHMEVVKDTNVNHAVVEKIIFQEDVIRQYVFQRPANGLWQLAEVRVIPISESHNASFLQFYHQFASDADYQQHHLNSTVAFVGPDPDDDFAQMEGIITPDTWEAFAPQLPKKMIYNIVYGKPEQEGQQKVFVMRGIANGLELEMTFRRKGSAWKLTKLTT